MSLTAGATLQNGKYLIQTVLHQTDASISYQATHTSLNHPVVIHTLNPSLRELSRFSQLRQQFLAIVKQGGIKPAIVRDCFEENEMPYAVLEPTPTPLKLTDWMPFLSAAPLLAAVPNSTPPATPPVVASPQNETTAATQPVMPAPKPGATAAKTQPVAPQLPSLPTESIAPSQAAPNPLRLKPFANVTPRRARWIPVALLLTACTAGLTGAAIAWKIRSGAAAANAPALFSREQSFPEKTDWLGEDPYADDSEDDYSDSASPAIERRSVTPRRPAIEPEPEYAAPQTRTRQRRVDRSPVEEPRSRPERQPSVEAEEKPAVEAPKVETFPDPIPEPEAPPPAAAPVVPEALPPVIESSPKVQFAPPAEPISQ